MTERTLIHASAKFRVERFVGKFPEGGRDERDVVVHPGAAVILPLLDDRRVVLIRNYRIAVGRTLLELPAGTLSPPESPADCAARELIEETGYRAGRLTPLLEFFPTPGICTERMHVYIATELAAGAARPEADERIEVCPMEYDDALRAVRDGRIEDAKTIVALLVYDRWQNGEAGRR